MCSSCNVEIRETHIICDKCKSMLMQSVLLLLFVAQLFSRCFDAAEATQRPDDKKGLGRPHKRNRGKGGLGAAVEIMGTMASTVTCNILMCACVVCDCVLCKSIECQVQLV